MINRAPTIWLLCWCYYPHTSIGSVVSQMRNFLRVYGHKKNGWGYPKSKGIFDNFFYELVDELVSTVFVEQPLAFPDSSQYGLITVLIDLEIKH